MLARTCNKQIPFKIDLRNKLMIMAFSSGTSTRWPLVHCFKVELEFGVLVFVEGGKVENPEKNPRSREENQKQTQSTCDAWSGNGTRATAVGGECSHHRAIPAPRNERVLPPAKMNSRRVEWILIKNRFTPIKNIARKLIDGPTSRPTDRNPRSVSLDNLIAYFASASNTRFEKLHGFLLSHYTVCFLWNSNLIL